MTAQTRHLQQPDNNYLKSFLSMAIEVSSAQQAIFYWYSDENFFLELSVTKNEGNLVKWNSEHWHVKEADNQESLMRIAAESRQPTRVDDCRLLPHLQFKNPCVQITPLSEMTLPIFSENEDKVCGILQLLHAKRAAFTIDHETELNNLCLQAKMGISLEEKQNKLKVLRDIDKAILKGTSEEKLFCDIVHAATRLISNTTGQLYDYDRDNQIVRSRYPAEKKAEWNVNSVLVGKCILNNFPEIINDIEECRGISCIELKNNTRSLLILPISNEEYGVIGALRLESPVVKRFTSWDVDQMADLCRQTAIPLQYILQSNRRKEDRKKLQEWRNQILTSSGHGNIYELALNAALELTSNEHGQTLVADNNIDDILFVRATTGEDIGNSVMINSCASGELINNKTIQYLKMNNLSTQSNFKQQLNLDTKSALMVPFNQRTKRAGIINLESPKPNYFTDWHVELVQEIVNAIQMSLEMKVGFSSVVHHFKSPVNNIDGQIKEIIDNNIYTDVIKAKLERMQVNAQKLQRAVDDIMRGSPKPDAVDPIPLLEEVLKSHCDSVGVKWEIHGDDSVPAIYFDRRRLERVFDHLVDNAVRAMENSLEKSLRATFMTRPEYAKTILLMEDTGSGIPKNKKDTIFMIGRSNANSSGLGLYFVKEAMTESGGNIEYNAAYTNGTSFKLEFQRACGMMLLRSTHSQYSKNENRPFNVCVISKKEELRALASLTWGIPQTEIQWHPITTTHKMINDVSKDTELIIFDANEVECFVANDCFLALQEQFKAVTDNYAIPGFFRRTLSAPPRYREVLESIYLELCKEHSVHTQEKKVSESADKQAALNKANRWQ
ncbi:MAG: ATP-binding protein [Desulfovibrio sp.]